MSVQTRSTRVPAAAIAVLLAAVAVTVHAGGEDRRTGLHEVAAAAPRAVIEDQDGPAATRCAVDLGPAAFVRIRPESADRFGWRCSTPHAEPVFAGIPIGHRKLLPADDDAPSPRI